MAFTRKFGGRGGTGAKSTGGRRTRRDFNKSSSNNSPFRSGEFKKDERSSFSSPSRRSFNERGRESSGSRSFSDKGTESSDNFRRSESQNRSTSEHSGKSSFSSKPTGVSFGRNGYGSFKSGGRRSFRSYRGGRSRGRGDRGPKLDHALFVKKAVEKLPEEAYIPKNKFSDFEVNETLKKNIKAKGFIEPTPIQDQTIELALKGNDVIGIANTGTGKTAAFLIPLIDKIFKSNAEKVLIIVPTRELATQIDTELRFLTYNTKIRSVQCIGGTSISNQIQKLRYNPNFVIGTPGRLKDLTNQGILKLGEYNNLVLDEVDRMVDMGFINDIKYLLAKLPEHRQSLFFSATISNNIERLITNFMHSPKTVAIKGDKTSDNVDQDIVRLADGEKKIEKLHDILTNPEVSKALIFVKTKMGADRLDRELFERGFKVSAIHGDKSQYKRQQAIDKFKQNKVNILVATDVAARGLDIPNVSHVINYDLPQTHDDYAHRIGRTGRANNKGKALTFVD